jgi:hypothetical protein
MGRNKSLFESSRIRVGHQTQTARSGHHVESQAGAGLRTIHGGAAANKDLSKVEIKTGINNLARKKSKTLNEYKDEEREKQLEQAYEAQERMGIQQDAAAKIKNIADNSRDAVKFDALSKYTPAMNGNRLIKSGQTQTARSGRHVDSQVRTGLKTAVRSGADSAFSAASREGGTGGEAVNTAYKVVKTAITGLETAGALSDIGVQAGAGLVRSAPAIGRGAFVFGSATFRIVKGGVQTAVKIRGGEIKMSREELTKLRNMALHKVVNTRAFTNILVNMNAAGGKIRSAADKTVFEIHRAKQNLRIMRGVLNGSVKARITKEQLALLGARYARFMGKNALVGLKSTYNFVKHAPKIVSGISGAGLAAMDVTGDMGGDAGHTIKVGARSAKYTFTVVKTTPKVATKAAKGVITSVKRTKTAVTNIRAAVRLIREQGLKNAAKTAASNAKKALAQGIMEAARKTAEAAANALYKAASRVVLPLLLVLTIIVMAAGAGAGAAGSISAIFGGSFNFAGQTEDTDAMEYLKAEIDKRRGKFAELAAYAAISDLSGRVHFVRFFMKEHRDTPFYEASRPVFPEEAEPEEIAEITSAKKAEIKEQILSGIPSAEALAKLFYPVFQTVILRDYNLEPTEEQLQALLDNMWNITVSRRTEGMPTEWCKGYGHTRVPEDDPEEPEFDDNPDITSPLGGVPDWATRNRQIHCNVIHASGFCPNWREGDHGEYYICPGHCCYEYVVRHDDGSREIIRECGGYTQCLGHRVEGVVVSVEGFYALLNTYFYQPIENLSASENPDDQIKLADLQDYLEICLEQLNIMYDVTGAEGGNVDLSTVAFIDGDRAGNTEIVNRALAFVGQAGGQPFWSYMGYSSCVEWCACFVSFVAGQTGYSPDKIPRTASTKEGAKWFKDRGEWQSGGFSPSPGDIIFFDWNGDGAPNHVGIVVGTDGAMVYTIEGNSGDVVRTRAYPVGGGIILGYGLPSY